jgi:hypothetical protein
VHRRRQLRHVDAVTGNLERAHRWELEMTRPLEVGDPHRAVGRRAADGAVPLREDLARRPAERGLAMRPEEVEIEPFNRVEHTGVTLGSVDAADHGRRWIGLPVDRAVALADQRARPADHARVALVHRLGGVFAGGDRGHGVDDGLNRGAPYLVAVEAALARLAGAECACGPNRAASTSAVASRTVTPHSVVPSSIAQSSEEGPRSPLGPGCTTRQRCVLSTVSGMIVLSIGQTISSGS